MAEKIKKGFFKVLPWSVVILLIIGVSVGLLNSVPKVQPVKAGAGDGASSVLWLLDTNANGKIDRITFNIANPNVETWSLTGASPHGLSVTQAGADITISSVSLTTAANANPVGVQVDLSEADPDLVWNTDGVTASVVELIYTQAGYGVTPNIQDSVDEELNAIATGDTGPTDTEIDKAAPVHLSTAVLYKDITAVDGQVDRVDIQFSENIQLSEYDDADWSFPAAGDINLANESAATAVGNVIRLTVAGDANETGGATSPTVSYSAAGGTANSLKDNATAPNNAASFGPTTVGDGAAPARVSALYKDINGDGTVDRIDITMSADVGLACTWNAGDWSFPAAGTVNVTGSSACAVAGNDIRLTVTGTTAATTGGVTNPTVVYTNNASRVVDGATIATATWAAVTATDAAAPVPVSAAYKDADNDGSVERIDITMTADTGLACTWNAGDWSFPVAGTVNVTGSSACAVGGNDIRLTVTGTTAWTTGGVTNPTVIYTNNANRVTDGAANYTATWAAVTATDAAAPWVISARYLDNNPANGRVDRVEFTTTADTGIACTAFTGNADFTVGTAGEVGLASNVADTCASNGTSTVTISLATQGTLNTTGGATTPVVTYTQPGNGVEDGIGNDMQTAVGRSVTDAAAPVPVSALYKDADANGTVDRIDVTMTADVGLACTFNVADWSFGNAGSITANTPSACAISGNDIRVSVSADANETGGAVNPTIIYTNIANRITDGAANNTATWAAVTATDGAAPVPVSALYADATLNGQVDQILLAMSADVGLAVTYADADWTITAGTVNLANETNVTALGNQLTISTLGDANVTGGAAAPAAAYTNNLNRLQDGAGNFTATFAAVTATDGAAPVPVSALYKDADANGTVDRIDVTMTADVGLACTFNVADWSFPVAGTVNVTGSSACAISGNDIRLSVTGTTAATTGGVTNPTIIYTNNANRVTDGAANNTATWAAVTATDGAAPVPVSAVYQDWTGPDGQVDRIVLTMSNDIGLALTAYADLDWTITAGSVGLANETWVSAGGLGLTISTLGTANVTGGGVNPAVAYTNNANRLGDGSGNFTATFGAVAATDNAAPIIVNTYSTTTDTTGKVKAMDITFSESILDASVTPARFEFDNDSTNNATGEEAASGGSTNVTYPAVAAVANDQYYRLTVTTGITGTEVAYLHHNTLGLTDSSPAANQLALGDALGTENDEADPVIMTTSPANTATDVDVSASVALTFSEAMTTGSVTYTLAPNPGGVAVVWSGGNTIATYSHTAFNTLTLYTFTATAGDSAAAGDGALSAGPVANPFTFTTLAGGGGGGGGGGLPASVTVTAPNGGEILAGGGTYNIVWSAPGVSDTVSIYYSLDSGINFPNTIATAQTNDGSYTWTVPNISSSTVKIKAVSGSLNDISDSNFVITYTTPTVSVANSTIIASPTSVVANGTSFSIITVTVKDAASVPLSGKVVTLASSRGTSDTITTVTGTTGADGKATFNVYSSTAGTSTYTATAAGTVLTGTVSVVFTAVGAPTTPPAGETPTTLSVGDLIKSSLSTSVYYYGSDNKRHVFPNEKTYKSWYPDWAGIKTVTTSQLQGIALGANVKVRPGTVLVKIDTNPKVYAVEPNGLLRWVPTETRANTLYGSAWATKIIDVPLVFWVDYTFGSDISTDVHPTGALVKYTGLTDTYYIQGAEKRLIATESAFNANRFQWANVLTIPTTLSYANGTDVTAAEDALVRIY